MTGRLGNNMKEEEKIVTAFYSAFQNKDIEGMISCYHDDITFEDPAFGELKGNRAKAMWTMLIERGKNDLIIQFSDVTSNEKNKCIAHWVADYKFGPKKRPVKNEIDASFETKDGKIFKHKDVFNVWTWSRQSMGIPGMLFGWTGFMQKAISSGANKQLDKFMVSKLPK